MEGKDGIERGGRREGESPTTQGDNRQQNKLLPMDYEVIIVWEGLPFGKEED